MLSTPIWLILIQSASANSVPSVDSEVVQRQDKATDKTNKYLQNQL